MIQIAAIRGQQGNRVYYTAHLTYRQVATLVEREPQSVEVDLETVTQRDLDMRRVRDQICPYLLYEDRFFPPIVVEHVSKNGSPLDFTSVKADFGYITLMPGDKLLVRDGQHRVEAIKMMIGVSDDVADDVLPVVITQFQSLEASQRLFTDINRYAKPVSKTVAVLIDRREASAAIARYLARHSRFLRGRVSFSLANIQTGSRPLCNLGLLDGVSSILIEVLGENPQAHLHFWDDVVFSHLPLMDELANDKTASAVSLRQNYMHGHGGVLKGIAAAYVAAGGVDEAQFSRVLREIDWRKSAQEWSHVVTPYHRIVPSDAVAQAVKSVILKRLGIE